MSLWDNAWRRYRRGHHEFNYLADLLLAQADQTARQIGGFCDLSESYSFYVERFDQHQVQAFFGSRPMFRPKIDEPGMAAERGAALTYSLGPTGSLMVGLYPCKSDLSSWKDEALMRVYSSFSAEEMRGRLHRDLADLACYCRVTSIDAQSSIFDQLRITWLSLTRSKQIKGKFTQTSMRRVGVRSLASLVESARSATLELLLKPLIVVALLLVITPQGHQSIRAITQDAYELAEKIETSITPSAHPSQQIIGKQLRGRSSREVGTHCK